MEADRGIIFGIYPQRGEDAGDFVVIGHGAGQGVVVGPTLDQGDPLAALAKQDGKQGSDGACTDDGDISVQPVDVRGMGHGLPPQVKSDVPAVPPRNCLTVM